MTRKTFILAVLVLIGAGSPSVATGEESRTYLIELDRPTRVGDSGKLEVAMAERGTTTTTWRGNYPRQKEETESGFRLVAQSTVTAVNAKGSASEIQFLVETFAVTDGMENPKPTW